MPPAEQRPETEPAQPRLAPGATTEPAPVRALTDEQIAFFKALGAEVCIGLAGGGSVWLVPEYTGAAAHK